MTDAEKLHGRLRGECPELSSVGISRDRATLVVYGESEAALAQAERSVRRSRAWRAFSGVKIERVHVDGTCMWASA